MERRGKELSRTRMEDMVLLKMICIGIGGQARIVGSVGGETRGELATDGTAREKLIVPERPYRLILRP
jgi:hypothetical protein